MQHGCRLAFGGGRCVSAAGVSRGRVSGGMKRQASSMRAFAAAVLLIVAWAVTALPASAESLNDAMSSAYVSNPTLRADRARQRATDEQVPQAISGWRPTVTLQSQLGYEHINN